MDQKLRREIEQINKDAAADATRFTAKWTLVGAVLFGLLLL